MKLNFQPISNVIGVLMLIYGAFMLFVYAYVTVIHSIDGTAFLYSSLITMVFGFLSYKIKLNNSLSVNKREGYIIVVTSWLIMALCGALPYHFAGVTDNYAHAFFESASGFTTTGASIFNDIESLPKGILVWRSLTQWIGGMGIIVLTVALLPLLGIAGIELFVAEAPGPTADKLHPRIKETAKRLWFLYVGITALLAVLLLLEGMNLFDAVNHAFTTMATGGFSTKNASIAYYENPAIHYTLGLFMFIAGTNYFVIYHLAKGHFKASWSNEEFRWYFYIMIFLVVGVTLGIYASTQQPLEKAFRDSFFMVNSIVSTTGYVTADYTSWNPTLTVIFFLLLFLGASAGSTAGGIKIIRHMVFAKNSLLEFKRILHPRALIRIKISRELVPPRILTHILVFLLIYLLTFFVGMVVVVAFGVDIMTAAGAVATSLGNVGPGIGEVGPVDNFYDIPDGAKCFLGILMIMGRLELFTVLVLFTPYFWKTN